MPAPDFVSYMRAAVLASNPVHIHAWDDLTLRSVFNLLPTPAVTFDLWRERESAPDLKYIEPNTRFIDFAHKHPEILHVEER